MQANYFNFSIDELHWFIGRSSAQWSWSVLPWIVIKFLGRPLSHSVSCDFATTLACSGTKWSCVLFASCLPIRGDRSPLTYVFDPVWSPHWPRPLLWSAVWGCCWGELCQSGNLPTMIAAFIVYLPVGVGGQLICRFANRSLIFNCLFRRVICTWRPVDTSKGSETSDLQEWIVIPLKWQMVGDQVDDKEKR